MQSATPDMMEKMTGPVCHYCEKEWSGNRINVAPGIWACVTCTKMKVRSAAARQTRMQSLIEVATGTMIGFIGSAAITYTTLNLVNDIVAATTITVTLCTVWSFVRQYGVRRFFEMRKAKK